MNGKQHTLLRLSRRQLLALGAGAALTLGGPAWAVKKNAPARIDVVATFSILGDMVREIGGDYVNVTTLVGPDGDAHTFEPSPRDVKALANAKVLVLNGLDFESWLPRLLKSSGFKGAQVLASKGVTVRHLGDGEFFTAMDGKGGQDDHGHGKDDHGHGKDDHGHGKDDHDHSKGAKDGHGHGPAAASGKGKAKDSDAHEHHAGDADPHAWQSLSNGIQYARNIAQGLTQAAPAHGDYFQNRAALYIAKMEKLDREIKTVLADIPESRRTVITSHDAFGYFGDAYGIRFISLVGFSGEADPSARDVARIVDFARKKGAAGIFVENVTNPTLVRQIAKETGARVGGTLYSDALAKDGQPAGTYLGMFSWNAGRLIRVLKEEGR